MSSVELVPPEINKWPSIFDPQADLFNLQQVASQLKQSVELLTGQAFNSDSTSVDKRLFELRKTVHNGDMTLGARIIELNEVVVTNTSALAQRTLIIEAEIQGARGGQIDLAARITQVDQARVDGDSALAVRATTLEAEITDARSGATSLAARITQVDQARVNGDSALATSVNNLTTQVGANTANITTLVGSYDAMKVKYSVVGNINGVTGGFEFTGVQRNDGSVSYDMVFNSNVTINGNLLITGSVNTPQIAGSAVSQTLYSEGVGRDVVVYVTARDGARVAIIGYYSGAPSSAFPPIAGGGILKIEADGAQIAAIPVSFGLEGGFAYPLQTTVMCSNNPAAGVRMYRCWIDGGAFTSGVCGILVMELAR